MFNFGKSAYEEYAMPKKETNMPHTCYSIGMTDDNRVSLYVGYSNVIMNVPAVNNLIQQLELFRDQIQCNEKDNGK